MIVIPSVYQYNDHLEEQREKNDGDDDDYDDVNDNDKDDTVLVTMVKHYMPKNSNEPK